MNKLWLNDACKLYESGLPYCKIAKIVEHSRKTVSYYLRGMGYESNQKYVRRVNPIKLSKYDYSKASSVFKKIDTEEKAYWMGFLYADGYMDDRKHCISLCLKEEDKSMVLQFRKFLGLGPKKLHKKTKNINNKQFYSYEFSVNNRELYDCLINLGCFPRKTYKLRFPTQRQVPSEFIRHFVRGYFDGDGSVTHSGLNGSKISIEMLGTKDFLMDYQKWTGFTHNLYNFNHSDISRSIYCGAKAIIVLDNLYKDSNIYMSRKYEKYLYLRRLAITSSKRVARELADKIGEGLTADTEVTAKKAVP
nr:MAG TPA: Intein splicing domain [Caudoviricetes sp.]